ncbi:MAG: WecB/TagA/CpsF family glycosyltransferase [Geminicoccaceae bacterium]
MAKAHHIIEQLHQPMVSRVALFGVQVDVVRMEGAVQQLLDWVDQPTGFCRYVVTPNVDHTVMLQHNEAMRTAYHDADLVLPDGYPVVWASRILGRTLPERVAGSDLVPALFAAADPKSPLRIFLLGAGPGVAARAAKRIEQRWPGVEIVDTYSPPFGFEHDDVEQERILAKVRAVRPDVLIVGLGAPKQEIWVHKHRTRLASSVVVCAGATIDFLAGEKSRAPRWIQRIYMEWLYRLLSEPRRLFWRYAKDAWIFPQIVWREWRSFSNGSGPDRQNHEPYRTG